MDMHELLQFAIESHASDIHLSAGMPPLLRVSGDLRRLETDPLDEKAVSTMLYDIMDERQRQHFEEFYEVDFSFEVPKLARFRVNVFNQARGISGVLRSIPLEILSMEQLKLPEIFKEFSTLPRGLVLVTGPTGSGKSTTLAAMLDYINKNYYQHIITIEDPIEFVHQSRKSLFNQREVNRDTKSFSSALRSALREDPDIILVGEMRDLETIRLALTAAETGHLVFATLHTTSAAKTVNRIIDPFPAGEKEMVRSMLSESLQAVISQVLLKKNDGGRAPVHEIMVCNSAIRNLIREDKIPQIYSAIQTGAGTGMQTLEQDLKRLVNNNVVQKQVAQSVANTKDVFTTA